VGGLLDTELHKKPDKSGLSLHDTVKPHTGMAVLGG
jgi:hypothetical protein